jgi:hypothetical protein
MLWPKYRGGGGENMGRGGVEKLKTVTKIVNQVAKKLILRLGGALKFHL